jgi:hypothetical protein
MNLVIIKYCLLIGAVLTSTALVAGPLNPQKLFSDPGTEGNLTADSIYQFGSDVFYKEIDKPGNEYMKSSVEGYSQTLLPSDEMEQTFQERWSRGVSLFLAGYAGCSTASLELSAVPGIADNAEKAVVCTKIRTSREEMLMSLDYFAAAKSAATPGSSRGFTIGMVIPRIKQIESEAEDAEITCMRAVLADREGNREMFEQYLKETDHHVREMRRIYPELGVISNDFRTP